LRVAGIGGAAATVGQHASVWSVRTPQRKDGPLALTELTVPGGGVPCPDTLKPQHATVHSR
jgi:hypothetical protein